MAMQLGSADGGDNDEVVSAINTTPLVDVMLVLLIIFLITIPVVTHTVAVVLPTDRDQPSNIKPRDIVISVNKVGNIFWSATPIDSLAILQQRLDAAAVEKPQPSVQILGDESVRYAAIGKVVMAVERAGIVKIGFVTRPPANGQ